MEKITPVDIQHKSFKKALQGYERADVDKFLDEIIETLEDEAHLKERVSHFKAIEESLQNTLVLAQRTADEVKASAHKEADLIREQARLANEREIAGYSDTISDVRREQQRAVEATEKAKSELRSLLMTHLALLERTEGAGSNGGIQAPAAPAENSTPVEPPLKHDDTKRITVY
jgi:cell division initiation protein